MNLEHTELEKQFHGGNPAYKDELYEHLKVRLAYAILELKKVGVMNTSDIACVIRTAAVWQRESDLEAQDFYRNPIVYKLERFNCQIHAGKFGIYQM